LIPLLAFLALAALFMFRLGAGDPSRIPSALIGHVAPPTNLPPLPALERDGKAVPGIDSADFKGEVTVLNVWASWCVSCREEHPVLLDLARTGAVPIVGLNYKDKRDDGLAWLKQFGDPYNLSIADSDGRVGINYGVYGVPETFLIDKFGVICDKVIGPVTRARLSDKILPLVKKLEQKEHQSCA
jgi:cytochrome c biogenesis protein CcmG/thiol:disulfide interchange protein DsbE